MNNEKPVVKRSLSSEHRVNRVIPSLPLTTPISQVSLDNLTVTTSRKLIRSVAVSFGKSSLISTQLNPPQRRSPIAAATATATTLDDVVMSPSTPTSTPAEMLISIRLNELNPLEPDPLALRNAPQALWNALFWFFAANKSAAVNDQGFYQSTGRTTATCDLPLPSSILHQGLLTIGAIHNAPLYTITRAVIFQQFSYALASTLPLPFPYQPVILPSPRPDVPAITYPLRPNKCLLPSPVYSRFIPALDTYYKLEQCTMAHAELMHGWLNDARVDVFWQEKGTLEQHEKFIQDRISDPHVIPVIGSYVQTNLESNISISEPATYSEIYWVKEDRLGPLYPSKDYDRGIHVLVGSNLHRGSHRVRAWLPSLVHYCLMDDVRTERVVAEPNELNEKMIKYFESVGFVRHGSVQFPHKISALSCVLSFTALAKAILMAFC